MKPRLHLLLGAILAGPLAADPSAPEAAANVQLFSASPHFQLTCRLTIVDNTGDRKVRDLKVLSLRDHGEESLLVQAVAPAYLKNLKFLRVQSKDGVGTWLRTTRGTQRMPPDADPEPLFGSDFTTADFQPGSQDWVFSPNQEEGTLILERPADRRLGWTRQVMTLRASDRLILKSEFFDASGTLVRRYSVQEFSPQGRPARVLLEDEKDARHSELAVQDFDDSTNLSAATFAPGRL